MRILIQRVLQASVTVNQKITGQIKQGLLLFVGIHAEDEKKDADYLIKKCLELRLFSDQEDKMNLSVQDISGELLVISQFTLYASCQKGRRPSFTESAKELTAKRLYDYFVTTLKKQYPKVQTGIFKADMKVELINDGPVTFLLESPQKN